MARFLKVAPAQAVKNCLGQNMSQFEGCVCRNNGVTACVQDGYYYLSPDSDAMSEKLAEGFKDSGFMVICSQRPAEQWPDGLKKEWQYLRETR